MKPKSELLLCQCLWIADILLRPTWRNVTGSFEEWAYRNGFLRQIQQLEAQGWLESRAEADGTGRLVRLTEKGVLRALGGSLPEARWNRPWDGKWRMVVFDVPENKRALRNSLRRQLKAARFGGLQGSVWVSPDPLDALAGELKDTTASCGVMTLFEAETCGGESHADLVSAAWDFSKLGRFHEEYLGHLKLLPGPGTPGVARKLQDWWQRENGLWQACMAIDPLLPRTLWPEGYAGEKAWKAKKKAMQQAGRLAAVPPEGMPPEK